MNGRTLLVTLLATSCGVAVLFCTPAASPARCPVAPGTPVAAVAGPPAPPDFWTPERMRQARGTTMPRATAC
jgi:hypothetical protein